VREGDVTREERTRGVIDAKVATPAETRRGSLGQATKKKKKRTASTRKNSQADSPPPCKAWRRTRLGKQGQGEKNRTGVEKIPFSSAGQGEGKGKMARGMDKVKRKTAGGVESTLERERVEAYRVFLKCFRGQS